MKSIFCHKAKAVPPAANTLRFEFSNHSYSPVIAGVGSSGTWKRCEFMPGNVWDWTRSGTTFTTSFQNAFTDSGNLVSVIAAGDTSSVTNMSFLFRGCSSLVSVTLFDTSNVTDVSSMFRSCTSLTSVPLFDTSNVTNMNDAFNGCTSLTSVPLFDTSKVTGMNGSFNNCVSLTSVPLFDTSSTTNTSFMFRGCTSLTSVPLFDTSNVTNMGSMLNGCTKVEGGSLALYQQASTQETPPTSHTDTFKNCGIDTTTGAAELAQIPTSWGGTKEEV